MGENGEIVRFKKKKNYLAKKKVWQKKKKTVRAAQCTHHQILGQYAVVPVIDFFM